MSAAERPSLPPPIRLAATVVVVRPGSEGASPLDVLMVRRSRSLAFMGGAYVFPGGRVDDGDAVTSPGASAGLDGLDQVTRCADLSREAEAAFRVASIRELLEEAGVLLARRHGTMVDDALAAAVRASLPKDVPLASHVAAQGLRLALDAVMPFARWVTPPFETRRFDTLFLMARMPAGQVASHDEGETTALEWVRPADAVARGAAGEIVLAPPTWTTLSRLARFTSVDEAWNWARLAPIVRIEPEVAERDGVRLATLPAAAVAALSEGLEALDAEQFAFADGVWRPVDR